LFLSSLPEELIKTVTDKSNPRYQKKQKVIFTRSFSNF